MAQSKVPWFLKDRGVPDNAIKAFMRYMFRKFNVKHTTLTCYEAGHTWTPYCREAFLDILKSSATCSLKIYTTFYLLSSIARGKPLSYYKNIIWKEILTSTAFLTTNAAAFMLTFCAWSHFSGGFNYWSIYMPAAFASMLALAGIERPSRHNLLALYMLNLGLEVGYDMLKEQRVLPHVPGGEILLFMTAMAGFVKLHREARLRGFLHSLMNEMYGSNDSSEELTKTDRLIGWLSQYIPGCVKTAFTTIQHKLPQHKTANCQHQQSCLQIIIEKFGSRFLVGYMLSLLIKSPGVLSRLIKQPSIIVKWFTNRENLSLGFFLATMSSSQQLVSCILRGFKTVNPATEKLISGAISGLSMLFYRSPVIALYTLLKLIDLLYVERVNKGELPKIKNIYIYIYSVSTALLFHAAVWAPHLIRPAYWKFMLNITGSKFMVMNRVMLDKIFHTTASVRFPDFIPVYDPRFSDITPEIMKELLTN